MIDAVFYDDPSVPDEWKERLPGWLVAIGLKVQGDLLDKLRVASDENSSVQSVKAYLSDHGLRRLEPIQVSLHAGRRCLYHDWTPDDSWGGAPYEFFDELASGEARVCVWEDLTSNDVAILPMRRWNLAFVGRAVHVGVQVVVELHWGNRVAAFEHQVDHLRPLVRSVEIEVVDASQLLVRRLLNDPDELYRIGPERFEDLLQDRITAMGFVTQRTGRTFAKDGGVDLLFWKEDAPFPFLGALQAKYHSNPSISTGSGDVREFRGSLAVLPPMAVGILVTNTSFSFDAKWVATKLGSQIRLRDQHDLRRWISGRFVDVDEWREIPIEIELCPGVRIRIPRGGITNP